MTLQRDIIQSFTANAERTAIESGGRVVLYNELSDLSSRISGFLLNRGLTDETMIGIMTTDRINLIAAIIGTLNARCVFIPLDPALPTNRLDTIVRDLDLKHVLIDIEPASGVRGQLERQDVTCYAIGDILSHESSITEYPQYNDDDSVYVYFTSGSTGTPKGIVGKNISLKQFIHWEIETFGVGVESRVSQFISPYFDAFLRDVFVPIVSGGTVCIPPPGDDVFTPAYMTQWVDRQRIGLIHCVPSVFRILCSGALKNESFLQLKYVLMSGERITPTELVPWYNVFADRIKLVNLYGATETTMIRSYYEIKPGDVSKARIPIGRPIAGTELLVSNRNFEPAAPFVAGDLYIVSKYVTKGYLNDPAKTQQKFIARGDGTIAFKTGDKARRLPDGQIDLIGREDRQIKLRGIRIELDEIEHVIMRSGLVRGAAVIERPDLTPANDRQDMLVGFMARFPDNTSPDEILEMSVRKYLAQHIPDYMIPSRIVIVKELPRLSNGKLNYRELVSLLEKKTMIEPANETERQLLGIWKEILGEKPISTTDTFQAVGGNSISMMSLIGKIHRVFEVKISLVELIHHLSIQQQAQFIVSARKDQGFTIQQSQKKEFYPLSSAQERIYYSNEYKKNTTLFNLPLVWAIDGELNVAQLERAFTSVIDRHETLRTSFKFANNRIVQVISDSVGFKVQEVSVGELSARIDFSGYLKPFDLSKAPLLRATIFHCADQKVLLIDLHHIICDGISQALFLKELSAAYRGEVSEALPIQYRDYVEWELAYKSSDDYKRSRAFWLQWFEGDVNPLRIAYATPATESDERPAGEVFFQIHKKDLKDLDALAGQGQMSIFSALFSAYFLMLFETTGQQDVVVGTNSSGRLHDEVRELIGMFTKTLPIRQKIDAGMRMRDFVAGVHQAITGAIDHQLYDLADLAVTINQDRVNGNRELFNTMFIYQGASDEVNSGSTNFKPMQVAGSDGKFMLSLFARDTGDCYNFRFEYLTAFFGKDDIESMADKFRTIVEKITTQPDSSIIEGLGIQLTEQSPVVQEDISFSF